MSNNVNKIILVGNLGRDPELRYTQKGSPFLTLSLATDRDRRNAAGEKKTETEWHRATLWGPRAEGCAKYLTKGSRIYLEGELRSSTWKDKEGISRRTSEIHVDDVKFLGGTKRPESTDAFVDHAAPALTH